MSSSVDTGGETGMTSSSGGNHADTENGGGASSSSTSVAPSDSGIASASASGAGASGAHARPSLAAHLDTIDEHLHGMYPPGPSHSHHYHGPPPNVTRRESSASDDMTTARNSAAALEGPLHSRRVGDVAPATTMGAASASAHPCFSHPPWAQLQHHHPHRAARAAASGPHQSHHLHHHATRHPAHPSSSSHKGKARAMDIDVDSLEDASLRPSVSATLPPDTTDDDTDDDDDDDDGGDESDSEASSGDGEPERDRGPTRHFSLGLSPNRRDPLIRIRRVGALGISVSSGDSERDEIETPPQSGAEAGGGEEVGTSEERTTSDSGCNGVTGESSDLDSAGDLLARRVAKPQRNGASKAGVLDEDFRKIVDDLAVENQALRARLRRYEAARVPPNLKRERLFEIRYFEGLPEDKRDDLETFLTRYVQGISQLPMTPLPALHATRGPIEPSSAPTTIPHRLQITHTTHPVADTSPLDLPPPKILDRRLHRSRKSETLERDVLAGPSDFGHEPPSLTGTGAGIKVDSSGDDSDKKKRRKKGKKKRRRSKKAPTRQTEGEMGEGSGETGDTTPTKEEPSSSVWPSHLSQHQPQLTIDAKSRPLARDIVSAIEKLFEDAFEARRNGVSGTRTNEEYLGQLLEKDFLSDGWIYLNLVCTMAMTHRFSVTQPFIQLALRSLSKRLKVSGNGTKVRWIGPEMSEQRRLQIASAEVAATGPSTRAADPGYIDRGSALQHRRASSNAPSTSDVTSTSTSFGPGDRETSWNGTGSGTAPSTAATSIYPPSGDPRLKPYGAAATSMAPITRHTPTAAAVQRHDAPRSIKRLRMEPLGSVSKVASPTAPASSSAALRSSPSSLRAVASPAPQQPSALKPYTPFFARREDPRLRSSRAGSTLDAKSTSGDSSKAMVLKGGSSPQEIATGSVEDDDVVEEDTGVTGTMLFYAGARFCTDLSRETPVDVWPSDKNDPTPLGLNKVDPPERSPSPDGSAVLGKAVRLILPMEDDDVMDVEIRGLEVVKGSEAELASSSTRTTWDPAKLTPFDDLEGLKTSGMTDVVSADAFTVLVTSQFDDCVLLGDKRPLSDLSTDPPTKRPRLDARTIVETRSFHHEPTQVTRSRLRKDLSILSTSSSSNNSDESSEDSDEQPTGQAPGAQYRSAGSGSHASRPRSLVHMPSPDYLASLNLPLFTWAPHAPSSRFHWSQQSGQGQKSIRTQDGGNSTLRLGDPLLPVGRTPAERNTMTTTTMTTTSEEDDAKEIDLDESV